MPDITQFTNQPNQRGGSHFNQKQDPNGRNQAKANLTNQDGYNMRKQDSYESYPNEHNGSNYHESIELVQSFLIRRWHSLTETRLIKMT